MDLNKKIKRGEIIRVFTGAKIPRDVDTVIMQEDCNVNKAVSYTHLTLPTICSV